MPLDGLPTAAQMIKYTDQFSALFRSTYTAFGLGAPTEQYTFAAVANTAKGTLLGDGSGQAGLGSPRWESDIAANLNALARAARWDVFWGRQAAPFVAELDSLVQSSLPSGWSFPITSTQAHVADLWISRLNGLHPSTPVTPSAAGTLTPVVDPLGTLPNVVAGSAPRVVHTIVSANGDWIESLPSAEATQVALSGAQDAYSYQVAGTVPSGAAKMRIYRGFASGAAGTYYYDQEVALTPGQPFPAAVIRQPDRALRTDIRPPSWASCLVQPEFACLFALAYSTAGGGTFGVVSDLLAEPAYVANAMLSPHNVALRASSEFLGLGNQPATAQYGTSTLTGASTQTWAAGGIQTTNQAAASVQGYVGAVSQGIGGLRARVVTALTGGTATLTIDYDYLAAATGQTVQTQTAVTSATINAGVGSTASFTVPAGRIVKSVTVTGKGGAATAGAIVIEGMSPR